MKEDLELTDEMLASIDNVDNAAIQLIDMLMVLPFNGDIQIVNDVVEAVGQLLRSRGLDIYYPFVEVNDENKMQYGTI